MIDPGATVWPLKSCTPREGRPQKRIQEASDLPRDNHRKHNNHEFCLIILIRLPINLYSIQLTMKSFAAISTILTALAASVAAAPTPDALPAGFQPITRDEIMRRLETSSAETNPLEKRTPGGVSHAGLRGVVLSTRVIISRPRSSSAPVTIGPDNAGIPYSPSTSVLFLLRLSESIPLLKLCFFSVQV